MPNIQEPLSQLPLADLPLTGDELMYIVQDGNSRKTSVAGALSAAFFGPEYALTLTAGNNNNVLVTGNRLLADTTAGDATITGFDATGISTGYPLVVTNLGPNALTLADANGGSLAANQLFAITDLTLPPRGSFLLERSGTLLKWVLIS